MGSRCLDDMSNVPYFLFLSLLLRAVSVSNLLLYPVKHVALGSKCTVLPRAWFSDSKHGFEMSHVRVA